MAALPPEMTLPVARRRCTVPTFRIVSGRRGGISSTVETWTSGRNLAVRGQDAYYRGSNAQAMKLKPVDSKRSARLADSDARVKNLGMSENEVEDATRDEVAKISELQRVFYADARFALLIVLQGRDAAGKDGTIRKVFTAVNPQGCTVTSFKAPTELERHHDFLWRIHHVVPERGMIGIFNRSHYEDVLVPRVHDEIDANECRRRYRHISDFERMLSEQHVVILKFFLHISRDEQKRRLNERLRNRNKNWKFRIGD